jgi:hypothetical protein
MAIFASRISTNTRLRSRCNAYTFSFNSFNSPFQQKILLTVFRLLADSSKDGQGRVLWTWWDEDDRRALWAQTLTHNPPVSITFPILRNILDNPIIQQHDFQSLFPLWVHCLEVIETGRLLFSPAKLDSLQIHWEQWVRSQGLDSRILNE